ncbi:MAG: nucleotidyltransferase substrate binding protein [Proteobacteria bacterium]|nr:nucleotidyltransferase substrate binding protein [Pseudomonadota bacterium]
MPVDDSEKIDISHIVKAQKVFEQFRQDLTTDKDKTATVQAFEFCYELSWKLMKRVLNSRGLEVASPKDTFRQAALNHLIDDPELWFEFQKKRNLTVHSYNKENLEIIISIFDLFSKEMEQLIAKLREP